LWNEYLHASVVLPFESNVHCPVAGYRDPARFLAGLGQRPACYIVAVVVVFDDVDFLVVSLLPFLPALERAHRII